MGEKAGVLRVSMVLSPTRIFAPRLACHARGLIALLLIPLVPEHSRVLYLACLPFHR